MSSFQYLNLNDGTTLKLGYITKFFGLNGYSPFKTNIPSGLNLKKYKAKAQSLYIPAVETSINYINNSSYESITSAMEKLTEVSEPLLNNVVWLYGSLYEGGAFLWSNPNINNGNSCQVVMFYGLFEMRTKTDPVIIEGYNFLCNTLNLSFEVYVNNNEFNPISDNYLYFFNYSSTDDEAPTNEVCNSEFELKVVDTRSIYYWTGQDDYIDNRWIQTQTPVYYLSNSEWLSHYLDDYTEEYLANTNPHPWLRYIQTRVNPNMQWFTGINFEINPNYNGVLVGGFVPIEKNIAVTDDNPSGGDSGGGGGGYGQQNGNSEEVGTGDTPSSGFLSCGIARIFLPTTAQMTAFSQYLFSDIAQSSIDQLKKMWSNPLDYIENVAVCRLSGLPNDGTSTISFGGISSGVSSYYTNQAFYDFEYTCQLQEFWKTALDYSNYTKIKIYIPYCGIYDISVDEAMSENTTIKLKYRIDIMSGMCVAFVSFQKTQHDEHFSNLNSVMYQFNGNIFLPLSLTATDWRNAYSGMLQVMGGMIAPSPSTAVGMASDIMGQKVNVQHSGSIGTNFGYMGIQEPYLIIERPSKSEPYYNNSYNYKTNYGYPSNKQNKLSTRSGYVKVAKNTLWTNSLHATDEESKMIKELLESGVWIS